MIVRALVFTSSVEELHTLKDSVWGGTLALPDVWRGKVPYPFVIQGEMEFGLVRQNSGGYPLTGAKLTQYDAI